MFGWGKKKTVESKSEVDTLGKDLDQQIDTNAFRGRSGVVKGKEQLLSPEKEEADDDRGVDFMDILETRKKKRAADRYNSDDSGSESDFEKLDTEQSIRRTLKKRADFGIPKQIYDSTINPGEVQGKKKIDQVLDHLKIVEDDYVWWNFDTDLTVHVPGEMGGGASWNSMSEPPKESRSKTSTREMKGSMSST